MSCDTLSDCKYMSCDKLGSDMICSDGRCACTLPRKKNDNSTFLLVVAVVAILMLFFVRDTSKSQCMNIRAMKSTSRIEHDRIPPFIQSDTFKGAKEGYVFKTDAGQTGYYRDIW